MIQGIQTYNRPKSPHIIPLSKATEYNWRKLGSDSKEKLTKRANKTKSVKQVIANSYLESAAANALLSAVSELAYPIESIIYSLIISLFTHKQIIHKVHIQAFLKNYQSLDFVEIPVDKDVWESQEDVLGFIYQSLLTEGERNITGQYYTDKEVVDYMLGGKTLADDETFLDPCCGSGAFLLGVSTNNPSNLYGFDINPIAVMIASANLLAKYADAGFTPHIYCVDFLKKGLFTDVLQDLPDKFDYIYTNPPWGSDKAGIYSADFPLVKSKERSSMVLTEALDRLKETGTLYFVLPSSLLKIKIHNDIRKYLLSFASIRQIDLYDKRFDGVFTDFFSIKLQKEHVREQSYIVTNDNSRTEILLSESDRQAGDIIIESISEMDKSIMQKMESLRHDDLIHSRWALGIVTGDNKNKVKKECEPGMEPVYSGKQVEPFFLRKACSYIFFDPKTFQQCAKTEYFRASEKLIYRFIAKYPIVAYDDRQCLCLNSANILIPEMDGISIKSVAALLNSTLYRYYYSMKFSDIKVLKGNLQALPFPKLTKNQDEELSSLVSSIQRSGHSDKYQHLIDHAVYSIFNINQAVQIHIQGRIK